MLFVIGDYAAGMLVGGLTAAAVRLMTPLSVARDLVSVREGSRALRGTTVPQARWAVNGCEGERHAVQGARVGTVRRGCEEHAGTDSEQKRRVEVQWFTIE